MQVLEEQALRMITWSGSLNNDYLNEQQHRMNQDASAGCSVLITHSSQHDSFDHGVQFFLQCLYTMVVSTVDLVLRTQQHGHANFCERIGCAAAVVTAAAAVVVVRSH
eukprot:14947-Heterococcus_DN1.PRE.3